MASRERLQFIDVADFTKGISSRYHSVPLGEQPEPDGFARESETFGCYALPDGGLAPLPRITFRRDGGDPATVYENQKWPHPDDGYPEDYFERIAILDAKCVSPVTYSPDLGDEVDPEVDDVDLFTVRQWYMVTTDDTKVDSIWRFRGHPVYTGSTSNIFAAKELHALEGRPYWNPDPSRWLYGWGSIMETRTVAADLDPIKVGPPVLVAGMGAFTYLGDGVGLEDEEGYETAEYFTYPDVHDSEGDQSVMQDRTKTLPVAFDIAIPGTVFGHQGRLCVVGRQSGFKLARRLGWWGDNGGVKASSEIVMYWPVNDVYSATYTWATFLEEATTGYGTWNSVNANSLLLVKNKGGAVLVQGDINNPQVTRLPGVPSVGGLVNRGVMTDKGYIYGSVSGVWLWTGSDTATELSAQLDPEFWVPDDPTVRRRQRDQLIGSFGFQYPYLFAPNNWMFDLRTGGWWRYHPTPDQDPANGTTFAFNETDAEGNLWAFPASYELNTTIFAKFDRQSAVDRYSWRSQPIARSRNRMLNYRQLTIVMSGAGRVRVDVFGLDGESQTEIFDNETDTMVSKLASLGLQTQDVEVRITAEAFDPELPAPIVHRFSLGYLEAQSIGSGS